MTVRPSQIKKYEIEYIEPLRENVKKTYRHSKGEELHITNYKENPYYTLLIDDIEKYTKKKISEGTILKFFYQNKECRYRVSTIDIFEEYIRKALPFNNSEKVDINKNERQESESQNNELNNKDALTYKKPFSSSEETFKILILPFRNPEDKFKITEVGQTIKERIQTKNDLENLGIELQYNPFPIDYISDERAKKIGIEQNVDIVIWGNDSKPNKETSHLIYFHYAVLENKINSKKISSVGKTGKFETKRLIEITEGELHLEIDDIIYWLLGNKYYLQNDFSKALITYQKIIAKKYLNETFFFNLASCNYHLTDYNNAKIYLKKAIKVNPNFYLAHNNIALVFLNINKIKFAKKHLELSIKSNPNFADSYFSYASLLENNLNRPDDAIKYYLKAIQLDSTFYYAYNNYASLLLKRDNINEARIYFKKAILIKPDNPYLYYNYATCLIHKENLKAIKEAKYYYETAISLKPDYFEAINDYAFLLSKIEKNIEKAKDIIKKALISNPNFSKLHFLYANILMEENNIIDAKNHIKKVIELDPEYAEAYNNYAEILMIEQDIDGAKEYFDIALALEPTSSVIHYNYALLLAETKNNFYNAKKHYKKAIYYNSDFAEAHYQYASLLFINSNMSNSSFINWLDMIKKAIIANKHFKIALKIYPIYPEFRYQYAIFLNNILMDINKARIHYYKAINENPELKTKEMEDYFNKNAKSNIYHTFYSSIMSFLIIYLPKIIFRIEFNFKSKFVKRILKK